MMRTEKEIDAEIEELTIRINELRRELKDVRLAKSSQNSKYYKKRKYIMEQNETIFASIIKPGDFVKVTGSRTSPYRKVIEIDEHALISATCTYDKRAKNITRVNSYDIITCGTNKITSVLRNGKWVTAKELCKNG